MKTHILIIIIFLFASCNRPKLSRENLMSVYKIGWTEGYKEGLERNSLEWSESQRKIDESQFYLDYHLIFESLPERKFVEPKNLTEQPIINFNDIPISIGKDTIMDIIIDKSNR